MTWRSLKPEIASVDTAGYVTGLGPGRTVVQVSTSSRLMATLPVEVSQPDFALSQTRLVLGPGESDTVRVMVPAQGNREIRGLVRWRSTDSTVVSVGPSGIVRGLASGKAEIIATGFSQERRAQVVVHPQPDALVVSPQHSAGPVQLPLRATRRFTAVAEAADSTSIPEAHITWQLGDTSVAAFDRASGVLTPKALGTTTLTATAGRNSARGLDGAGHPRGYRAPAGPGRAGGRTAHDPERVLKDEQGAAAGRATGVRWSSDKPEVAVAREGGVIDAVSPGRAVITAAAPWGKSAKAEVFVVGDLLLSSNRGGSFAVYQMRVTGPLTSAATAARQRVRPSTKSDIQASLSPDRTRIAFSSNRSGNFDIYMMDADGQQPAPAHHRPEE